MGSILRVFTFGVLVFLTGCDAYHDLPPENDSLNFEKLGVSFNTLNEKILIPKCLRCHQSARQGNHFIDLSSYEKIISSRVFPPLVVAGRPEESSLYTSVREFRMPDQGAKLKEEEIEYIKTWILLGAKKEKVTVEEPRDPVPPNDPGEDCEGDAGSDEPGGQCSCKKEENNDQGPPDEPGEPCDAGDTDPNEP